MGEKVVSAVEGSLDFFVMIVRDGLSGIWGFVKDKFTDLKEFVLDAIKDMVITEVIKAGIKWLLSLLNPVAALFKAIKAIIDIVKFFIERAAQVMALVEAFIGAVKAVATGSVGKVSGAIENALARAIPVVIGFLAALLGLSGLSKKVQDIVERIRKRVNDAIDGVLKGLEGTARKLFKSKTGKKADSDTSPETNNANLPAHQLQDSVVGETVTFNADGEKHQTWIKEKPGGVEVMVRSTEKSVDDKLDEWSGKLDTLPEDKKAEAQNLISSARAQNQKVEKEGNGYGVYNCEGYF